MASVLDLIRGFDWAMPGGRLFISFSGGRTSALMTKLLVEALGDRMEVLVVFANTGEEDPRTLDFVHQCDKHYGFNTTWVEAAVDPRRGKGTRHRVVSYETARHAGDQRNAPRPFEHVVQKFGVANQNFPNCTRELKLRPMTSFVREQGWQSGSYVTAIGIRADEIDRKSVNAGAMGLVYPLASLGIRKEDVISAWKSAPFDLRLPEHRGNCVWCWKKSDRKLFTLATETPEVFDTPTYLEDTYPDAGPGAEGRPRRFFRKRRSARDIVHEAQTTTFKPFGDPNFTLEDATPEMDLSGGCADSCEVDFAMEQEFLNHGRD